jgi:hypothetical protein
MVVATKYEALCALLCGASQSHTFWVGYCERVPVLNRRQDAQTHHHPTILFVIEPSLSNRVDRYKEGCLHIKTVHASTNKSSVRMGAAK